MVAAKVCAAGVMSAIAAATMGVEQAYADSPFKFPPFSAPPATPPNAANAPPQAAANAPPQEAEKPPPKPRNDNPRTTSAGFDPEALERGVKAVERLEKTGRSNEVFKVIVKEEETKQAQLNRELQELKALQAQAEADKQRVVYEEQRKLMEQSN